MNIINVINIKEFICVPSRPPRCLNMLESVAGLYVAGLYVVQLVEILPRSGGMTQDCPGGLGLYQYVV